MRLPGAARRVGSVLLAVACWAAGLRMVEAASGDADGTYTVTVTKVEVSKDGTTYKTIFNGSQDINIASVDAGAVAAGLASGAVLDVGTYTTVRVTIGSTLKAKGYVNSGGDTVFTTSSGSSTNVGALNTPGTGYDTASFTIPAANLVNTTTGLSMVVAIGKSPTVTVTFDTSGVLTETAGNIIPGAPTVTITGS